ncbi:MAG: PAS domain S-box protein [Candidatus Contendobacter sp.]|jgi:two-component system CheB/CheR fusion protein|nr:PAS domain S-box protein [Gammaproteobacteria bacterium]MCC8993110.1 PAS domain S-box protein [Candidatus Contendobacter sp.]
MCNDLPLAEDAGSNPLYYVGVGASAGGLEALESFFTAMPADTGMAFIVIQHLSPDYKSMMVELLSKRTAMPVRRAEEGMLVEANSVYLIPPKKNLSIFHGKLLLSESDHSRGINLPIDIFLRSLADDQAEKAIGVILSGTGNDGVRGIRALKEAGGMVMVQSEESARFDGMPRAAIATGLADFILPPDKMPPKLIAFSQHPYAAKADRPILLSDEDGLTRIFALLRERTRVDFTFYKPSTMVRRIERRMTLNQMFELRDYVKFMESYSSETTALYRELLIGVTSFFRDREVFEELENLYLPQLFSRIKTGEARFWVAGCSTGEEAYSLAIISREVMKGLDKRLEVKIFATDLDRDAILRASSGIYPESVAADLPTRLLSQYFHRKNDQYQIDRSIREMVVFAQHNLIKDPPFTNIDLVSCRNLLIYLQPVLQHKSLELINFSLNPQGLLLLGTSETTGDQADLFESLHQKFRIYSSRGKRRPLSNGPEFAARSEPRPWLNRTRFSGLTRQRGYEEERLLDRFLQAVAGDYVPLAVMVNEQMEVLHIFGNPEGYFQLSSGKLINDIAKIAVKDLAIPLETGLQKVFATGQELKHASIRIKLRGEARIVQIRIRLLPEVKGQEPLAAVFIEEVIQPAKVPVADGSPIYDVNQEAEQRIRDLEQDLQFSRENLQATIEELETSNEELQATNEELLASNEELQSTNEELQSVNEELRTVNEELHTVNAEHQNKIIELIELNNDLDNLMVSTRIGTLFLDENLAVRRFTPAIRQILKILESDIGRPIDHLMHTLVDFDLFACIHEAALTTIEQEQEVRTRDGAWLLMRILPYHVGIGAVSGMVLTFTDIGLLKITQDALSDRETRLSSLYRAAPVGIGRVINRALIEVNDQMCRMVGYEREELIGQSSRLLYSTGEDFELVDRAQYAQIQQHGVCTIETRWRRKNGAILPVLLSFAPLNQANLAEGATFTVMDLFNHKQAMAQAQVNEERYRRLFETMAEGVVYQNAQGEIISANPAARHILGLPADDLVERASANSCWKVMGEDGTDLPDDQHPSMIALHTGQPVTGAVVGIFNPQLQQARWLRVSAIPLFDRGTETPSQVYATFNDITDIVSAGRELTHAQREFRESERIARAALDAMTAQVAILDETGAILTVNQAWRDFGLDNNPMLPSGHPIENVNYLQICDNARGVNANGATTFADGIRVVIRGERESFTLSYPYHSLQEERFFIGRVSRLPGEGPVRIVVIHEQMGLVKG